MKFLSTGLRVLIGVLLANTALARDRQAVLAEELPRLQTDYRITPFAKPRPETDLSRAYYRLLNRYVRYTSPNFRDWPSEPGAKFNKADGSKEMAVRQNATVAFAYAVLSQYGDFDERVAGRSRESVRADAVALTRYLAVTHVANFLPTGDGKPWGDHWQSAFWAAFAGKAAWLIWDHLPDDTRVMVARMMAHEANRFNERPPDDGRWRDTKAEENAWNSQAIVFARCMFQNHPNARLWHERAIVYMMNSFSTEADLASDTLIDGRPVKEWVTTTCIHPDYTLENHDRVHPDYLSTFALNLRNAIAYKAGGLPIPEATFHNTREVAAVLNTLTATNGSFFYVNGQDWWPHRHELPLISGGLLSLLRGDAHGAFLERASLAFLQRLHARFDDGRGFARREYNYANAEEEVLARYTEMYLTHRYFGPGAKPVSAREFQKAQLGTRIFEFGGFVTHRTREKMASFAWSNGAMGLVYPREDTWFTSPYERSLTGRIRVKGAKDTPPALEQKKVVTLRAPGAPEGGFAFVGTFARCEGRIAQQVAVVSLPDTPVIYIERLVARTAVEVEEVATGIVAILNEDAAPVTRKARTIWTETGRYTIAGASEAPTEQHYWPTRWLNVDGKLGILTESTGRVTYLANHAYQRARLQQEIIANHLLNPGLREEGAVISESVVVLLPNSSHRRKPALTVERPEPGVVRVEVAGWELIANLKPEAFAFKRPYSKQAVSPLSVAAERR